MSDCGGANPTMTRDELIAAAESIGMRFPAEAEPVGLTRAVDDLIAQVEDDLDAGCASYSEKTKTARQHVLSIATQARPDDDTLWDETLKQRDNYHEAADKLAQAIAQRLGVDIGEHSSGNDPWFNALAAMDEARPDAQDAARYRWLRAGRGEWGICEHDGNEWVHDARKPQVVDAAIDAAMASDAGERT